MNDYAHRQLEFLMMHSKQRRFNTDVNKTAYEKCCKRYSDSALRFGWADVELAPQFRVELDYGPDGSLDRYWFGLSLILGEEEAGQVRRLTIQNVELDKGSRPMVVLETTSGMYMVQWSVLGRVPFINPFSD